MSAYEQWTLILLYDENLAIASLHDEEVSILMRKIRISLQKSVVIQIMEMLRTHKRYSVYTEVVLSAQLASVTGRRIIGTITKLISMVLAANSPTLVTMFEALTRRPFDVSQGVSKSQLGGLSMGSLISELHLQEDLLSPLMMLELQVCSGRNNILLGNTE